MINQKTQSKITPLGDRVLIKHIDDDKEQIKGGIIIPDSAKEKSQKALVIALGTGSRDDKGKLIAFDVNVNDTIVIGKYSGTEFEIDSEQYKLVRQEDILAIINN